MKRVTNTACPKSKNPHKVKTKGQCKSRDKKFNPNEYINSLIQQFHDHRFDTVRKRPPSTHRLERSSALAYTTPITQRTVCSSKVRSKSSYSQYRKKSVAMRDILRVDLDNAITEDDNIIHFTEETVKSIELTHPHSHLQPHHFLTPSVAARRIQRAWRKYQTLKVVRKYYVYYKNILKKERQDREQQLKQQQRSGERRELERTLKIKKNNERVTFSRTVRSNIPELHLSIDGGASANTTKELIREPSPSQQLLNQTKTVELPILSQAQVFHSEEYTSKDLKFVIELFRNREESVSRQIDNQLDTYCKIQAQLTPLQCFTSNQSDLSPNSKGQSLSEGLSPAVFLEMEKVIHEKYKLLRAKLAKQRQGREEEMQWVQRDQQMEGRMRRELRNIERCREDYMRSIQQLKESMLQLQVDSSRIERTEQKLGQTAYRVRKSYSADTLILRSILSEVTFKNLDLQLTQSRNPRPEILLQESMKRERREQAMQPICPTSPPSGQQLPISNSHTEGSKGSLGCYQFSDGQRLQEQLYNESNLSYNQLSSKRSINDFDEELVSMSNCESSSSIQISLKDEFEQSSSMAKEDANTLLLKECAQEMEGRIENILIAQIIEELYTSPKMYTLFKPYIERPFEFKPITDFDIFSFLRQQLPSFIHSPECVFSRLNQKINPNSLQILRLIRDFDFQIEEYELVLPEYIFKAYRKTVEQSYSLKIKKQSQGREVDLSVVPVNLGRLLQERGGERRAKRAKFLSFQRDLKIMYMKSVFNCYNELIIETKSFYTYMNGRSSIGPGELTLALREYNWECKEEEYVRVMGEARGRVERIVQEKCMLPVFKNYKELEQFQKQMTRQISNELTENEYKWVNYMDEVLELWQEISIALTEAILEEAVGEIVVLASL